MGEVFAGRYEFVDVLGLGGMGTVWRVWDLRDREYRAAKVLRQSDSASLLRFVRETATRIGHDHVVAPTGWSAEDDRVLFTMPLVAGGSVATLLADYGVLPLDWVKELTMQLLDALAAVHKAGLVHRDVKPANLLLDATGSGRPHLRLSDFGIAVAPDEPRLTHASEVVHTPGYSSPEAVLGADPEPAQDFYSVAMVMQEMLTGLRPGPHGDSGSPAGPFAGFIARLMASDLRARFGTADEARKSLDSIDATAPAAAESIEVFDQLPVLPQGWGPYGPQTVQKPARSEIVPAVKASRTPRPPMSESARYGLFAALLVAVGITLLVVAVLVA